MRNTFQQARQSEFIKLKSGMLNTVEVYYSANYQNRHELFFVVMRAVSPVALRLVFNGRDYGLGI